MSLLPVGSELAGDAQNIHHPLQLQLSTAYRRGNEATCSANPGAVSRGVWVMKFFQTFSSRRKAACFSFPLCTCSGR